MIRGVFTVPGSVHFKLRKGIKMVKIDVNLCTGCGDCASNCPVEAIKVVNNKATVNDQCIDCGACVAGCQPQAISQ